MIPLFVLLAIQQPQRNRLDPFDWRPKVTYYKGFKITKVEKSKVPDYSYRGAWELTVKTLEGENINLGCGELKECKKIVNSLCSEKPRRFLCH